MIEKLSNLIFNNQIILISIAYTLLFISISILTAIGILFLFRFKKNKALFNYLKEESELILTLSNKNIKGNKYLKEVKSFENLLTIYTKNKYPKIYYRINYNLAYAFSGIPNFNNKDLQRELYTYAISYSTNVLEDQNLDSNPEKSSRIFQTLGKTYKKLSTIEKDNSNLINAIKAYEEAYKYKSLGEYLDTEMGELKLNIGNCYRKLAQNYINNKASMIINYNKAIENYKNAYKIFKILGISRYREKLDNIQKNIHIIRKKIK